MAKPGEKDTKETVAANGEQFATPEVNATVKLQADVAAKYQLKKGMSPRGVIPGKLPRFDVTKMDVAEADAFVKACKALNREVLIAK